MSLLIGILDDDKSALFTFEAMAKTQNWKVMASTSFEDAKKWFVDGQIDIFLLDYHMPRINGKEALKILKKINPDIVVLLSSGYSINGEAQKILDEGVMGFIQKPYRRIELSRKVDELLNESPNGKK